MTDHLISLPPSALAGAADNKRETLALLALLGHFAAPDRYAPGQLEASLTTRFAASSTIAWNDITAWLAEQGIPDIDLADHVTALAQGNAALLHDTVITENDGGTIQLLQVSDQSQLRLFLSTDVSQQLSKAQSACCLLRVGYSPDGGYGYYYAGLPGLDTVQTKLTWDSVEQAGITGAVAILPPKPPVDLDTAQNTLHIMQQGLLTAQQGLLTAQKAHADALAALGLAAEVLTPVSHAE